MRAHARRQWRGPCWRALHPCRNPRPRFPSSATGPGRRAARLDGGVRREIASRRTRGGAIMPDTAAVAAGANATVALRLAEAFARHGVSLTFGQSLPRSEEHTSE